MSEDTDLKAFDAEFDGEDVLDESEETPASETKEEAETSDDNNAGTTEPEESEEDSSEKQEETKESEEPESSEQPNSDEQDESVDPKELARQAYEARQQARQEREAQMAKMADEHLQAAEDEKDLALRQLQIDAYTNKVNSNTDRLTNQYEKALNSIQAFQNPTPEVKEFLDSAVDEFEARFVRIDEVGNPVEVNGDLYAFLQTKAGLVEKLTQLGARKEKVSSAKEKANATPTPSAPAKESKVDPALEAFEKELDRW